jgi:hypothetical protein
MSDTGQWYGRALERRILSSVNQCTGEITIRMLADRLHQQAPYLNYRHLYRRVYYAVVNLTHTHDVQTETRHTANKTPILFIQCSGK